MYYHLSLPVHAVLDRSLQPRRQIETSTHPLFEMLLMEQQEKRRTLLHLINLSGHSQTG